MDINALNCNLVAPGTPFKVYEKVKDTTFPPGTKGFVSYLEGPEEGNPNIMFLNVSIIRRGKSGKKRINKNIVQCPIFTTPEISDDILYPTSDQRKHLVDLEAQEGGWRTDLPKKMSSIDFMGWLLAKTSFLRKMDSAMYRRENPIMQSIGLQGSKQMTIWSRGKKEDSLLLKFNNRAEAYFNDGRMDYLQDEFCLPEKRKTLLQELFRAEACLGIPSLEYNRIIMSICHSAIDHLKTILKDNKEAIKTVGSIQKTYKEKEMFFMQQIDKRLERIKENRELLEL